MAGNCERHLLFVFKELDLAKALFRLFFRLIRAAHIFALFGKHSVTAGNFFDHAALPGNVPLVNDRSLLWTRSRCDAIPHISENRGKNGFTMKTPRN